MTVLAFPIDYCGFELRNGVQFFECRPKCTGRTPRGQIESRRARRAGLLATNSIRMVGNRPIVERLKQTGDIFVAWSDRPWILEGANVRVSMIGFEDGAQKERMLAGIPVTRTSQ